MRVPLAIAGLTIAAAWLRAIGLDGPLWYDEIVTLVEFARLPAGELVSTFRSTNDHPLYSIAASVAICALGEHEWVLRLPAYLSGVACIPAVYWLGRAVAPEREAVAASAILAVSYHHVWFSQNARGYTVLLLCTLVATGLFLRIRAAATVRGCLGYAVASALGMYAHLSMGVVPAAHAVLSVTKGGAPAGGRPWPSRLWTMGLGGAALLTALVFLPALDDMIALAGAPPPATRRVATAGWAARELMRGLGSGFTAGLLPLAGGLAALGLAGFWKRDRVALAAFLLPGALVVLAIAALEWPVRPRFFFFLIGFAALLIARGAFVAGDWAATRYPRRAYARHVAAGLMVVVVAASAASLPRLYSLPKQDFEGALAYIDRAAGSDPVATAGPADYPVARYYGRAWPGLVTRDDLQRRTSPERGLWILFTLPAYMDGALREAIAASCRTRAVFRGTVGDGDVVVCWLPPA